jgi:hypothetical protein
MKYKREVITEVALVGETITAVMYSHPAINDLPAYTKWAILMASGKLFAITVCNGEPIFSRIYEK